MRARWIYLLYVVLLIVAVYLGVRAAAAVVSGI
jgi:hypothetical protein